MSSVFQENQTAALEQKLAIANRALAQAERDHDRLGGLLQELRGKAAAQEKRADLAETEKKQLEQKLAASQAIAIRAAQHEKEAQEATKRADKAESELQKAVNHGSVAMTNLAVAKLRIDELADQVAGFKREIGPFRNLIAALDARRVAEATIAAETARLAK